uniref:Uncharacterized protein LOC104245566 n=1 Tax=Nicotiana sylvestris TaxID=4096 RepID=A0A1U7YJT4_NICSY|nr:PREDICTED: uncharacterized protein LOC104245566 [Nicotiana sylvestris]
MVGEKVLLKVSPIKGIMRFGRKVKLSPRFIGAFEVLRRVGEVAYELGLPPSLLGVHLIFDVSMLWRYHADRSRMLDYSTVQLDESLGYEEEPTVIIDREVCQLRSKKIAAVKVQWRGHPVDEAIWEAEEDMRSKYPHLFSTPEADNGLQKRPHRSGEAIEGAEFVTTRPVVLRINSSIAY